MLLKKAKKDLSGVSSTHISLPFISAGEAGPLHLEADLTRAKFDELTDDLVQKTKIAFDNALSDAGLSVSDIDKVILNGGSTRIPAVQKAVKEWAGKEPDHSINPDEAVALGAAIQGGVISGDVKDIVLLDVTPLSLGIETMGGVFTKLIDRNTTIPSSKTTNLSAASGTSFKPVISTGADGVAFLTLRPLSLVITRTRPNVSPTTIGSPTFKVPC